MLQDSSDLSKIIELQQEVATASLPLNELMSLICERVQALTNSFGAVVEMVEGDEMVYQAGSGILGSSSGIRLKKNASLSGLSIIRNEVLYSQDTEVDERVDRGATRKLGIRSMICVPLTHLGKPVGVLKLVSDQVDKFSTRDISILMLIAGLLSASLAQASESREKSLAYNRLQESENKFRTLVETANDGIIITKNGITTDVNPAFTRLFGYDAKDVIGRPVTFLIPEEENMVARGDASDKSIEVLCQRKDGSTFLVEGVGRTMVVQGERIRVTSIKDITDKKKAELALRNSEQRARVATKAKSDFLANMSHEIRTPLNGIVGMTSLLEDTELSPQQQEYIKLIQSSADNLISLVNDILDFSKIEARKLVMESISFEIKVLVDEVINLLLPSANKKGIRLLSEVDPALPKAIEGDPKRIRQILLNLMGNAIKFTSEGFVSLKVKSLGFVHEHHLLRFEVIDTGIGIPITFMNQLFMPFSQVDASTTRKFGGTGLGLSICKQLVEIMNGEIGVQSELGKGSTFYFNLKMVEVKEVEKTNSSASAGVSGPERCHILVAEDNSVNALIARVMLEKQGHDVTIVINGKEAIKALEKDPYDLIFMDCQMPEMDGYEATKFIRSSSASWKDIPIIAMTANAMEGDREKCLAVGMSSYISKPMKKEDLIGEISKWGPKDRHRSP